MLKLQPGLDTRENLGASDDMAGTPWLHKSSARVTRGPSHWPCLSQARDVEKALSLAQYKKVGMEGACSSASRGFAAQKPAALAIKDEVMRKEGGGDYGDWSPAHTRSSMHRQGICHICNLVLGLLPPGPGSSSDRQRPIQVIPEFPDA